MITNQGGLDGKPEKQEEMKLKFEKICGKLQLPMWILISMQKDHNRKPMTGLWHWLEAKFQLEGVTIGKARSINYVCRRHQLSIVLTMLLHHSY